MASTKPVPAKAAPAAAPKSGKPAPTAAATKRSLVAAVSATSPAAREALAAAKGAPGWRAAREALGEALAAGDTALLLESRGQAVSVRRRLGATWQPAAPLAAADAAATFAALRKLAVVAPAGQEDPEFVLSGRKHPSRSCRVASRAGAAHEEVVVLIGAERPRDPRRGFSARLAAAFGRLVPRFLTRKREVEQGPSLPRVALEPIGADAESRRAALVDAAGYAPACELVAAAVLQRASAVVFEAGAEGVAVQFDIDGVMGPAPPLDAGVVKSVVEVLHALAGLDPKARCLQAGKVTAQVEGRPWPCTVSARRGSAGARTELAIEQGRPKFKTLADLGMPAVVAGKVQEFLKLESGLILLVAPRRGGLSTLFDGVIVAADRLLRDFVLLENAAAPRPEIQNVKPVRWDPRAAGKPVEALDAALRDYPNVLATCDLEDAELAQRLVAQAGEGRLVIVGLRGVDAADGLARLAAMGVDAQTLSRVLLGAVGCQLVRRLCPKCRHEYFPAIDMLVKYKIDPGADVTLFRAAPAGCAACTGTGYLGRTAVCEVATGPTVRAYLAKAADADVLRKAAAKDGMARLTRDAIAKAGCGTTSIEEVQRVFRLA